MWVSQERFVRKNVNIKRHVVKDDDQHMTYILGQAMQSSDDLCFQEKTYRPPKWNHAIQPLNVKQL